jgi:PPK2 family polyphosphate:nucleotide phosphotransferase
LRAMAKSILFAPVESPYLVPFDGSFKLKKASTKPTDDAPAKKENIKELEGVVQQLASLQGKLYAQDRYSVILIFQALDAAGKDGTIKAVMSGINPQGCHVTAFKQPSQEELDHDFLWRVQRALPERGRIGIFNRSHYEEVLVVRVHPGALAAQNLPEAGGKGFWEARFDSIREFERHLARNGTVVVKFWLNVSRKEQKKRLLERIEDPEKNWKFRLGDLDDRALWDDYQAAYEAMLRATSRPYAPWYAIPADDKDYMRAAVARILVETLEHVDPRYPRLSAAQRRELQQGRRRLLAE